MGKTKSNGNSGNTLAYGCLVIFGVPFALIGLAAAVSVVLTGYDDLRMQFWTETPCDIVAAKLIEERGDESLLYRVTAEYRYQWQGAAHVGTRVSLMDRSASSNKAHYQTVFDELEQHRVSGQPFRCWVNPHRPDETILYRDGQWGEVALMSLAAVLFGGVGCLLLGSVFSSWCEDRRKSVGTGKYGSSHSSRQDWDCGRVVHSDRKHGTLLNWISGGTLLMSAPAMMISGRAVAAGNAWALLGLIPAAIALLTQWKARSLIARWRRFGDSVLHLTTNPGVIGGEFRAVVRPERLSESSDGYQLRLTCTETSRSSGDDGPSTSTLWDDEQTVLRELTDDSGELAIPVLFHLPINAPTTELNPDRDRRMWKLHVKSLTPGHGYRAEFEVPIRRTSASDKNYKPPTEPDKFLALGDPLGKLKAGGTIVDERDDGGHRFTFPAGRHLGFALAMLFVQAVFVVAISVGLYFFWNAGWMYVAGLLGFGFVWALFDLLFHSEVVIAREGLEVRSGWFTLGPAQTISASDIQDITLTAAGSAGNVTAYDVRVLLKSKSSVLLAKRILPQTAAEQLRQRLLQLLRPANE